MKGPSDQAKLVFLGLLRTVSALAGTTEPRVLEAATASWHSTSAAAWGTTTSTAASASATLTAPPSSSSSSWKNIEENTASLSLPPLTLRLARRTDVPSIQRCNLATLPENYNSAFYVQHLRQWPELSLVVVEEEEEEVRERKKFFSPFPGTPNTSPPSNVVAYVLGKVEERRVETVPDYNDHTNSYWPGRPYYETEEYGHVTSLAVMEEYRRQGLAAQLMEQLHYQLKQHHEAASFVGLHVRQSNHAATRLYGRFGYHRAEQIPEYYQDGEDGYYMIKTLPQHHQHEEDEIVEQMRTSSSRRLPFSYQPVETNGGGGGSLFSSWRQQPQQQSRSSSFSPGSSLVLPRSVGRPRNNNNNDNDSDDDDELLSGTM